MGDTEAERRRPVVDALRQANLEVIEVDTAADVVEQAPSADVVVLGALPDESAVSVTIRLRADPRTHHTAILHRSNRGEPARMESLAAGADAYLDDPLQPDLLVATVAAVLRARHAQDRLALILATPGIGIWEWSITHDRVWWSPSLKEIHGHHPGESPDDLDAFAKTIHPEDRERVIEQVRRAAEEGELGVSYRFLRSDDTVGWLDGRGRVYRDPDTGERRMVGLAIEVTERVERTRALEALVGMSLLLTAAVSTPEVIRILDEGAGEVTGASGLSLTLASADEATMVLDRPEGCCPAPLDDDGEIDPESPVGASILDGRTRWFSSPAELTAEHPDLTEVTGSAWAVLPLTVAGETFGAIWLAWDRPQRFEPTVRNSIRAMAGLVAQAYRQAELSQRERLVAAELQRALLPTLPTPPGVDLEGWYEPASDRDLVGGDWFDAVPRPDGTLVLMIGDVAGHGIGAASHTAEVRHTLRAVVRAVDDPADALVEAAEVMAEGGAEFLTTALLVVLDPDRARLRAAAAGHPPPLVGRAGSATTVEVTVGPPLRSGLDRPPGPSPEHRVSPGDVLVLYTDGLIERRGESIDAGIDRVAEVVAQRADSLELLVRELVEMVPEPVDDIALVVARILGQPDRA